MPNKKRSTKAQEIPNVSLLIDEARQLTLDYATAQGIKLLRIDLITPSLISDKIFSVWLFFDTDQRLKEYEANATVQKIEDKYISSLQKLNCPDEYLKGIMFFKDTEENVQRFAVLKPTNIG